MKEEIQDTNKTGARQNKTTPPGREANKYNKTGKAVLSYMLCFYKTIS
jgi:hypothetical protein